MSLERKSALSDRLYCIFISRQLIAADIKFMMRYDPLHIFLQLLHRATSYRRFDPAGMLTDEYDVSKLIKVILYSKQPCMIAKCGLLESAIIHTWMSVKEGKHDVFKYLSGEKGQWWWDPLFIEAMGDSGCVFPANAEMMSKIGASLAEAVSHIDVLLHQDNIDLKVGVPQDAKLVDAHIFEPWFQEMPWTYALQCKKVLVVHPYAKTIMDQYEFNRLNLYYNIHVVPMCYLKVIPSFKNCNGTIYYAPLSSGGIPPGYRYGWFPPLVKGDFKNWFEAYNYLKEKIDMTEYDIALLGTGLYDLPLAAHVKAMGKKAITFGPELQLLFGIHGRQWEKNAEYQQFFNYSWTTADKEFSLNPDW